MSSSVFFSSDKRSLKLCLFGFLSSFVLTIIPFLTVINHSIKKNILISILVTCSIVQILIHLICFLHINTSSEHRWNLMALVFTSLIITIFVIGSLWIMWHLNHLLMN